MSVVASVNTCRTSPSVAEKQCVVIVVRVGCGRSLFRYLFSLESTIPIVAHACGLKRAAYRTRVLFDFCNLVAHVVCVDHSGVDATGLPIEYFGFHSPAQHIGIDLLLSPLCGTTINCAFVGDRYDLTSGTTTA